MIEIIPDMPEGTLGFRVAGAVTRDDLAKVVVPRTAAEWTLGSGEWTLGSGRTEASGIVGWSRRRRGLGRLV